MSGQLNSPWLSTSDLLAPVNALYQHQLEDAQSQSLLGDLAVKQQTLGLAYQKLAMNRAGNAALLGAANQPPPSGDGSSTTTSGSTSSGGGGGSFLDNLASVESGDQNIVSNTDKDSKGLTLAQGGNPAEISQGHFQIQTATWRDFAKQAGVDVNQYPTAMSAPRAVQAQVASVIPFNRFGPRTQTLMASRFGPLDTSQTVGTLAGAPALTFNPDTAGPRVGGTATTSSDQLPVPPIPPPAGDPNPANMAAVKQAATGLLAMPEADAATAYPGVVQALQSRGFAMNAPPTYPGHAALQAMVSGGTATAPVPITPSPTAQRTGGTDVAGPGAGPDTTLPPLYSQNQAYQTGIPGITIGGAASPLAPPGTTPASLAAPVVAAAPPGAAPPGASTAPPGGTSKPPVPIPPPAPSRMIQTEPIYQSGSLMGLTQSQGKEAAGMALTDMSPADLAKQMEVWRQQNITNRQTAATANVAQQTLDVQRQQQYYENQVKAGWEDIGGNMIRNRFTGETKYAGPPSQRIVNIPGVGAVQSMPGGGAQVVVPMNPAGITTQEAAEAQGKGVGQDVAKQLPALVAQGRDATQAIGNIDYGMSQLAKAQQGGINTGYFAPALTEVQSALKSLGFPTDKIPFINVDPSAIGNIQTAQKTLAVVSGAILQQALGDSQITDAKIQHFIHAQPGIETDPQALSRVLNWARSQFVYENEQSKAAVTQAATSPTGTLPLNWQAQYYRDHGFAPIYDPGTGEMRQPDGGAPGRQPPPVTAPVNPTARTAGTTYQTPKGPLVWDGKLWQPVR